MIDKNTYLPHFLIICLVCISPYLALAQTELDTKSGQLLTVEADGTYSYRTVESETDSDEFMGIEINALEDPNTILFDGDRQEKMVMRNLKSQLKNIEAKSTVERYNHKVAKEKLKDKIKAAKKAGLDQKVEELNDQYNAIEVNYDLANMRAEESYKLIRSLSEINDVNEDQRVERINSLVHEAAKRLGTDVTPIKSSVVDYSFEIDETNPEHIAHGNNCNITFNGTDTEIDKKRIEHSPQYLFGYTSDKLKHFLKEDNFLKCSAYLTLLDDKYYLNLDLDLATKDASRNYGFIDKGDMIKLTFINGDNFVANSIYRAEGKLEPYSGHTKYEAVYQLQDIEMELIEDLELDKIAIIWSSGFEEYPVYEIDVLQRQLECIKEAK